MHTFPSDFPSEACADKSMGYAANRICEQCSIMALDGIER